MECNCEGCPFDYFSEASIYANNLGCLPDAKMAIEYFNTTGQVWACHEYPDKACIGFINHYKNNESQADYEKVKKSVKNKDLYHEYGVHGKEYDLPGFINSYLKKGSYVKILFNDFEIIVAVITEINENPTTFLKGKVLKIINKISNVNIKKGDFVMFTKSEIKDLYLINDEIYKTCQNLEKEI